MTGRPAWPRPLLAVALAAFLFVALETALQVRAYLLTGQSILSRWHGQSAYVVDPALGLRLLRPNHTSGGRDQTIRSNSHGLRSPEIPLEKPEATVRIAVLGASTVMGAYAATNELTFPALLEQELRVRLPGRSIEVINAGMVGFGLKQQRDLFDGLVSRFSPDVTVVYPGFNDFAGYCRRPGDAAPRWRPQPLVDFALPPWLLSVELLLKNTVALRARPPGLDSARRRSAGPTPRADAAAVDLGPYRRRLQDLLGTLQRHGTRVMLATNARSYRPDQPRDVQEKLSATARFYNPCFDVDGLHVLYDRHNALMAEVAAAMGVELLPLGDAMPGGAAYFADASHFSEAGERFVAKWLAERLERELRGRTGVAQ